MRPRNLEICYLWNFFNDWVLDNNVKLNPEVGKGKFGNYEDWFGHENVWKEGSNWSNWKFGINLGDFEKVEDLSVICQKVRNILLFLRILELETCLFLLQFLPADQHFLFILLVYFNIWFIKALSIYQVSLNIRVSFFHFF